MGTLVIGIILVAVVAAIIVSLVKNKKHGKSSCGNNCAHCAMAGSCHKAGIVTVLNIDGMMCGMCESHVNDAIRNNFAITSVKSSHKTGLTQITSDAPLDGEKLREVIAQTGYEVKEIRAEKA